MESSNERLLRAIFGSEPQPKALKFSLNLDDVTVSVAISRNKRSKGKKCSSCNKCGGKK